MSLNAIARPAARELGSLVTLVRWRTVAKVDSTPSHRDTDVETAARRLPCPLEWHPGFQLSVAELRRHPDYRGQRYVDLGSELAEDGYLTPRLIGDAARSGHYAEQDL